MLVRVCTGIVTVVCIVAPTSAQAFSFSTITRTLGCSVRMVFGYPCESHTPSSGVALVQPTRQVAAVTGAIERHAYDTQSHSSSPPPDSALVNPATTTAHTPEQLFVEQRDLARVAQLLNRRIDALVYDISQSAHAVVQASVGESGEAATSTRALTHAAPRDYGADIDSLWRAIAMTNRIDTLGGTTINSPTISGGTITNSTFSGTFSGTQSMDSLTVAQMLTSASASTSVLTVSDTLTAGSISANTMTLTSTFSAPTTTTALLDTGGQVCNVQAYGAVGNNATDNYAAITAAIAACPEAGVVYFPPGVYRISQTITLDRPVTLQGTYAPRWSYSSTPRASIKPMPTFSGSSIIHVRDRTISGQVSDNNGGRLINISIDGNSYGSSVVGVYFEGLVRDWKLDNVDISQTSGIGFQTAQGSGSGYPRGFTITHLAIYSPASHGFRATALNDSYLEDVLVVGGAQRGFYLTSLGETKINNSRAVFNALEGLYIDGSTNNGGLQFTDFSTDRNNRHGVRISATGTTTITFNGLLTRRDGKDWNAGSEPPYAGVAVIGQAGSKVAPVFISNLSQIPGVDDTGSGTPAPALGVRVEYAEHVHVDGVLWGITSAYTDGGHNDAFIIAEDSVVKSGFGTTVTTTRYNQKWTSSTSSLAYTAGTVGIGTTSPSAQLHTTGTVRFANFGAGSLQTDANGNLSVSSDERLKNVVGTYTRGLADILHITPILYHWNDASGLDTETVYAGFSAQNVAAALPEAVGVDHAGFLTLSDRSILAAVVTAVQQVWEAITNDRRKITELEARIATLERMLSVATPVSFNVSDAIASSSPTIEPPATTTSAASHADDPGPTTLEDPDAAIPIGEIARDDDVPIPRSPSLDPPDTAASELQAVSDETDLTTTE